MGAAGRSAGSAQPGCAAAAPGARSGLSRPLPAVAGRPGRCGGGDSERTALRALGQPDSDRCPRALDARQGGSADLDVPAGHADTGLAARAGERPFRVLTVLSDSATRMPLPSLGAADQP